MASPSGRGRRRRPAAAWSTACGSPGPRPRPAWPRRRDQGPQPAAGGRAVAVPGWGADPGAVDQMRTREGLPGPLMAGFFPRLGLFILWVARRPGSTPPSTPSSCPCSASHARAPMAKATGASAPASGLPAHYLMSASQGRRARPTRTAPNSSKPSAARGAARQEAGLLARTPRPRTPGGPRFTLYG